MLDHALNDDLAGAINSGMIGIEGKQASENLFMCPTGNCTFPSEPEHKASYQTLAIESACLEVSSLVKLNNISGWELPHLSPNVNDLTEREYRLQRSVNNNTFELPADLNYTLIEEYTPEKLRYHYPVGELVDIRTIMRTFGPGQGDSQMDGSAVFSFTALTLNVDWDAAPAIFTPEYFEPRASYPTSPFAVECQFYPAIRTIRSAVKDFQLEEDIISTTRVNITVVDENRTLPFWHRSDYVLRRGTWQRCTAASKYSDENPIEFINGTIGSYYVQFQEDDGTWGISSSFDTKIFDTQEELMEWGNRSWYPKDCVWEVDAMIPWAMNGYLGTIFDDTYIHTTNYSNISTYYGDHWIRRLYANGTANLTSVSSFASDIAESMTRFIRVWGDGGNPVLIDGQSYRTETCIKVQWLWGILPASLVPFTIIFFALTIWRTRSQEIPKPPWKSSSLPVLIHGLERLVKDENRKLDKNSEMEDLSGDIKVRLMRGEKGWGLK